MKKFTFTVGQETATGNPRNAYTVGIGYYYDFYGHWANCASLNIGPFTREQLDAWYSELASLHIDLEDMQSNEYLENTVFQAWFGQPERIDANLTLKFDDLDLRIPFKKTWPSIDGDEDTYHTIQDVYPQVTYYDENGHPHSVEVAADGVVQETDLST